MRRPIQIPDVTPEELFLIPAAAWNGLIRWLRRNTLAEFRVEAPVRPVPAWAVRVTWEAGRGLVATVAPGVVGWQEGTIGGVPLSQGPSLAIPATAWTQGGEIPPSIAARFPVRTEAAAGEIIADLGGAGYRATDSPVERAAVAARGATHTIWRAEIWLSIPRMRQTVETLEDGRIIIGLDDLPAGAVPEILVGAEPPSTELPPVLEVLQGLVSDPGLDVVPVATVWAISPAGADPETVPDETFRHEVEQRLFYSLAYRLEVPELPPEGLVYSIPYTGLGGMIAQQILAQMSRDASQLDALRAAGRVRGWVWSV